MDKLERLELMIKKFKKSSSDNLKECKLRSQYRNKNGRKKEKKRLWNATKRKEK
jgi:hypothetical protein